MRFFLLILSICFSVFAGNLSETILSVDKENATIKIDGVDVGMSGFVIKHIDKEHSTILNSAVVTKYDKESKIATLSLGKYNATQQDYLPSGKWKAHVGDEVVLAFGYSRALLIAPNENVYYRITKALPTLEWVHPDIFTSIISMNGHPTPLKKDFGQMCDISAVGLLYFYINGSLITTDCKSMQLLQITPAALDDKKVQLPFYSRITDINANWFGEGSSKLKQYDPYYYELLIKSNPKNKELYNLIKNKEQNQTKLLEKFDMKDEK
jgi:Plasminogen-binding protein pgbA N-terminal